MKPICKYYVSSSNIDGEPYCNIFNARLDYDNFSKSIISRKCYECRSADDIEEHEEEIGDYKKRLRIINDLSIETEGVREEDDQRLIKIRELSDVQRRNETHNEY